MLLKHSVCILTTSLIASDPRILKQIHVYEKMQVYMIITGYNSYSDAQNMNCKYYSINQEEELTPNFADRLIKIIKNPKNLITGILRRLKPLFYKVLLLIGRVMPLVYDFIYWQRKESIRIYEVASQSNCSFFHANDIYTLPAALKAADGKPVIFDAHEYAPHELELTWEGRALINPYKAYLCWKYIPKVTKMTTVCNSIAQLYAEKTGVNPVVIRNIPPYQLLPFHHTNVKQIKLIHHGGATPERRLEDMIEVISLLPDNYTLTFMLVESGTADYINKLKEIADLKAKNRVFFAQPVSYNQLISVINQFDIGIFLLGTVKNTNYRYALPNKLFEFIMAGLCVAIGPSIEMKAIVEQYNCGVVADDFLPSSLAKNIQDITLEEIDRFKKNSLEAAKELNAEIEMLKLEQIYKELIDIEV